MKFIVTQTEVITREGILYKCIEASPDANWQTLYNIPLKGPDGEGFNVLSVIERPKVEKVYYADLTQQQEQQAPYQIRYLMGGEDESEENEGDEGGEDEEMMEVDELVPVMPAVKKLEKLEEAMEIVESPDVLENIDTEYEPEEEE